jgi:hypothetical protein
VLGGGATINAHATVEKRENEGGVSHYYLGSVEF